MRRRTAADRVRLHRQRRRRGVAVVRIAVDEAATADALAAHGFLQPGSDRAAMAVAVERLVSTIIREETNDKT
jgi:hypothetical protein